jgi:hypothetical protein
VKFCVINSDRLIANFCQIGLKPILASNLDTSSHRRCDELPFYVSAAGVLLLTFQRHRPAGPATGIPDSPGDAHRRTSTASLSLRPASPEEDQFDERELDEIRRYEDFTTIGATVHADLSC